MGEIVLQIKFGTTKGQERSPELNGTHVTFCNCLLRSPSVVQPNNDGNVSLASNLIRSEPPQARVDTEGGGNNHIGARRSSLDDLKVARTRTHGLRHRQHFSD